MCILEVSGPRVLIMALLFRLGVSLFHCLYGMDNLVSCGGVKILDVADSLFLCHWCSVREMKIYFIPCVPFTMYPVTLCCCSVQGVLCVQVFIVAFICVEFSVVCVTSASGNTHCACNDDSIREPRACIV